MALILQRSSVAKRGSVNGFWEQGHPTEPVEVPFREGRRGSLGGARVPHEVCVNTPHWVGKEGKRACCLHEQLPTFINYSVTLMWKQIPKCFSAHSGLMACKIRWGGGQNESWGVQDYATLLLNPEGFLGGFGFSVPAPAEMPQQCLRWWSVIWRLKTKGIPSWTEVGVSWWQASEGKPSAVFWSIIQSLSLAYTECPWPTEVGTSGNGFLMF